MKPTKRNGHLVPRYVTTSVPKFTTVLTNLIFLMILLEIICEFGLGSILSNETVIEILSRLEDLDPTIQHLLVHK